MNPELYSISELLRCELTAVHQQFVHILSLRKRGFGEIADRITEVDNVDFPNAMKIIDLLVREKAPIEIAGDNFQPGHSLREIVAAESEIEKRLNAVIERSDCSDPRLSGLLATAKGPRMRYADWLERQPGILSPEQESNSGYAAQTSVLLGSLLTVMEQAMIHAFIHHHGGRTGLADAAWHTSGAAMMQLTKFVSMFSARRAALVLTDMPSPRIEYETDKALRADSELARKCAVLASDAAANSDADQIKQYCIELYEFYSELADFRAGSPHPAENINPPAFGSFETILQKFVTHPATD